MIDPGAGLSKEQAKAERLKVFKRPTTAKGKKDKRKERIQEVLKGVGKGASDIQK